MGRKKALEVSVFLSAGFTSREESRVDCMSTPHAPVKTNSNEMSRRIQKRKRKTGITQRIKKETNERERKMNTEKMEDTIKKREKNK